MLTIGALSKQTGVKIPTIRYYEQVGLLEEPERSAGNQRRYRKHDLERLAFIRHARDLGFPIEAIAELIALSGHPGRPCTDATRIARQQLAEVRAKLARLTRLETDLKRIATSCSAGAAQDCYVLASLSDHSLCADDH